MVEINVTSTRNIVKVVIPMSRALLAFVIQLYRTCEYRFLHIYLYT